MNNFIKKVIFSIPLKHYIKSYVLGFIIFYFIFFRIETSLLHSLPIIFALLLFPFNILAWDSILDISMPKHTGLRVPFMIFKYIVLLILSTIVPVIIILSYKVVIDKEYSLSDTTAGISKNRLFIKKGATAEA
jgi:hypothetical protein